MQWEKIGTTSTTDVLLSRTPVPGGWLVLAAIGAGSPRPFALTFCPDPAHTWDAGLPPK